MNKLKLILISICAIAILASCASMPDFTKQVSPLAIFDEDATLYAHVKIDGNENVLANLLLNNLTGIDKDSLDLVLGRSHSLYVAYYEGSSMSDSYIQLGLQGLFPQFLVNASLNNGNGWNNADKEINSTKYSYKVHSLTGLQLATVSPNLIVLSTNDVSGMQDRYANNILSEINWPVAYDDTGLLTSITSLFEDETSISLYFPKAKSLIPSILQAPIELAIDYAFAKIEIIDNENLSTDIQFKMESEKLARGTMTALKLFTIASDIEVQQLDETVIKLSNIPFNTSIFGNM